MREPRAGNGAGFSRYNGQALGAESGVADPTRSKFPITPFWDISSDGRAPLLQPILPVDMCCQLEALAQTADEGSFGKIQPWASDRK